MAKKKRKQKDVLAGDRTPAGQLYRAVRRYVKHLGGDILVIGGIQLVEGEQNNGGPYRFAIAVRCLGRKPSLQLGEPK